MVNQSHSESEQLGSNASIQEHGMKIQTKLTIVIYELPEISEAAKTKNHITVNT